VIKTCAVLGSGVMGNGIAHSLAAGGFEVVMIDASAAAAEAGLQRIEQNLAAGVERGKLTAAEAKAIRARISASTSIAAAATAGIVIEAVPESMQIKHAVLRELEAVCSPDAIFATNTSALSIMKLIEIVRGLETSDEAYDAALEVAGACKKETVLINEAPGFATSRINAMIGNEAFYMLMEGVASARDIDKAMKLGLNHPMGPFEMGDLVGLDTRLKILEYLHASLGEKFRPCPLLVKYVKAGRLGRKAGRGVYDYPDR
jgi:3-hydroxybutyryl-CoA dehydrogenase